MTAYYRGCYDSLAILKYRISNDRKIDEILCRNSELLKAIADLHENIPALGYDQISSEPSDTNKVRIGIEDSTKIMVEQSSDGITANFSTSPLEKPYIIVLSQHDDEITKLVTEVLSRANQNGFVNIEPQTPEYKKAFSKQPTHEQPKNTDLGRQTLFD